MNTVWVRVLCLVILVCSTACANKALTPNDSPADVSNIGLETIAVETYTNWLFVDVSVNGSAPGRFIVDTGAQVSVVDRSWATTLHQLSSPSSVSIEGSGPVSSRASVLRNQYLQVGPVTLTRASLTVVDLSAIEARVGHKIAGILGCDLFKHYVVAVDYEAKTLELYDPRSFRYAGSGERLPLDIRGCRPFVTALVTPIGGVAFAARLVIDTGDSSTVSMHTPIVTRNHLREATQPQILHISTGLGGDSRSWIARLGALDIGAIHIPDPVVSLSEATRGSEADRDYDGLIGGELLRRFRIVFDFSHRAVILEPTRALTDTFPVDMSGLTLSSRGAEFKTVVIDAVDPESPAATAGISAGDLLQSIDGQPTETMSLEAIKHLLALVPGTHRLELQRGDATFDATLALRPRL